MLTNVKITLFFYNYSIDDFRIYKNATNSRIDNYISLSKFYNLKRLAKTFFIENDNIIYS